MVPLGGRIRRKLTSSSSEPIYTYDLPPIHRKLEFHEIFIRIKESGRQGDTLIDQAHDYPYSAVRLGELMTPQFPGFLGWLWRSRKPVFKLYIEIGTTTLTWLVQDRNLSRHESINYPSPISDTLYTWLKFKISHSSAPLKS